MRNKEGGEERKGKEEQRKGGIKGRRGTKERERGGGKEHQGEENAQEKRGGREEEEKEGKMQEILIYFIIASVISIVICGASYVLAVRKPESEKVSAYECGFDPFSDSRQKFEVRFFLVGILFIIFDLEISLLFPWGRVVDVENYYIVMAFLGILTVGLVYEWKKGGLE